MMRLSKIFKKPQDDNQQPVPKGIKPEAPAGPGDAGEAAKDASSVRISSVLNKELEKISEASSNQLYVELFAKVKQIYTARPDTEPDFIPKLNPLVERIIDTVLAGKDEIIRACLKDYPSMDEFLYYHVVNVCISAVAIGAFLSYERHSLVELGVAALVHDIGARDMEIIKKPGILSESDYARIKGHPEDGTAILTKIDPYMNKRILDAVRQEHERADGSGYPRGLVKEEIGEYAQIVGLADVYEAMMHRRPYRGKYTSLETVRIILKNKKVFSRKAIKALIEVFGLFPVDTLVQLNTKEIGVIVERNDDCISRPVIDVLIDSYGKELKQPRRVNMAENPVLYIDTCVKTQMDNPKV
jgi:HD-GYP domain-containing protein (c-di-GMP phosphodiesterase class II)